MENDSSSEKIKVIIDCDIGNDDAMAIMMCLTNKSNIDILGLTTVIGNGSLKSTSRNAIRLLTLLDHHKKIPVYKGCMKNLLGKTQLSDGFHGIDGLGDVSHLYPCDESYLQKEHAVNYLINTVNKHQGEITLLALAPLTNIAMAIRMDPTFGEKLKSCIIMGGNIYGKGNVLPGVEFNWYADPEAASIVINELANHITLIPLETCMDNFATWEWYDNLISIDNHYTRFMRDTEAHMVSRLRTHNSPTYSLWDQLAAAVLIRPDLVTRRQRARMRVALGDGVGRGAGVVDWRGFKWTAKQASEVDLVLEVDTLRFHQMVLDAVRACPSKLDSAAAGDV